VRSRQSPQGREPVSTGQMDALLTDGADRTVLIVEDDPISTALIEKCVQIAGHRAVGARDGAEALSLLRESRIPIVITDIMMPEMDGLELCRAIRAADHSEYVYIVIVTARDSKEGIVKGLEAGADEYLTKPIDQPELVARLKTANRVLDLEKSLRAQLETIRLLSITDGLTGVFNRTYFYEQLRKEVQRVARYDSCLSLIMCDIDHFKDVNDTWGHMAGDVVLKRFATFLVSSIRREIDWVARFGGEEFVIVLPETDLRGATAVANRLRTGIRKKRLPQIDGCCITASFGVAGISGKGEAEKTSADSLVNMADTCLYEAKREGRDAVSTCDFLLESPKMARASKSPAMAGEKGRTRSGRGKQ
jgi:two-component system, cell cycle response regulator